MLLTRQPADEVRVGVLERVERPAHEGLRDHRSLAELAVRDLQLMLQLRKQLLAVAHLIPCSRQSSARSYTRWAMHFLIHSIY